MDGNTFIRYDSLGTLDSHITCVTSLEDVLFLGNSYGDIRLIKGKESQILHNHHGEITNLVCKRCYRTGRNDTLYLLSGTSIGNVYLHLVFLDEVTGSRILYKFVTGYSVFSICPHPEFDVFNFKRLTKRLTVDFSKDVSEDSDNWRELPSLSISVESFILSLSNGGIYLVHNSNSFNSLIAYNNNKYNNHYYYGINDNSNNLDTDSNKNSPRNKERTRVSIFDQIYDDKEKYVIMCISLYSPYSNMKMNWHKRYISWIDREGFYVYLLPNFVSILYISSKHFGNPFYIRQQSLGFKEKMKKTEKIHYLYNIIDNSELYVSTDESDISQITSDDYSRRSSIESTPRVFGQEFKNLSDQIENRDRNRCVHMKRLRNKFVNHRYLRNNNNYGTMSRFLSDSVLVGSNNTVLCIKLVDENDEEFGKYHNLLLSTFPSKEIIGYRDMRSNISSRRTTNVIRGYIDYKLIFPEHFNILHIIYSDQNQFNLIIFDEGPKKLANKDSWQCYQFEKYNRNGSVTKYKLNLTDQIEPGNSPRESKSKITNMIFNLNCNGNEDICLISLIHYESISIRYLKGNILSENIIIGAPSCPGTTNKDDVYVCINDSIIRINYCNNYFNLLKYYITNCYNQNIVISHFKSNLISMLNSNIGCTSLGSDDKGRKYILDYIGIFVEYILESKYYEGFKIIVEVLNRYGKLNDLFGSVFTKDVRIRLEGLGFQDRLVDYLVEIIDEGNSLIYLQIIEWNLNDKVYNSLLNKIKTILVNQIYHLYNMFQDSEINMGIDSTHPNNRNYFSNDSYFDVLILLNNLNNKSEVELGDVYNMLYQFLQQTTCTDSQENILSYSLSDKLLDNSMIVDNIIISTTGNTKTNTIISDNNRLEVYRLETDEIYNRLLSLKYYHKCLSEKLSVINTKGIVFPSNKGTDRVKCSENWYIQRAVVNCNICNNQRSDYDKILSKLINKVGGELLEQNEYDCSNVLYFPCNHLVHEKCQIRLINQLIQYIPVNTPTNWINKHNVYDSNQLLGTCLTCLTE